MIDPPDWGRVRDPMYQAEQLTGENPRKSNYAFMVFRGIIRDNELTPAEVRAKWAGELGFYRMGGKNA